MMAANHSVQENVRHPNDESDSDTEMNTHKMGELLVTGAYECANRMHNAGRELLSHVEFMAAELQKKELDLYAARGQICKLEAAVSDSTRRLLRAFPTSSLDDGRLHGEYSTLRGSIEDWIWVLPVITFSQKYQDNMERVQALRIQEAQKRALMLLQELPDLQSEVFCAIICRRVWKKLFTPWSLGATGTESSFMASLERSMEKLKGDREATDAWRSNTLQAHAKTDSYNAEVRKQIQRLCSIVSELLSFVDLEVSDSEKTMNDLQHRVLLPAVKLAKEMNSTPGSYQWKWYDGSDEDWRELRRLSKFSLTKFTMIDSQTHCEVKEDKLTELTPSQRIGRSLLVIYPALFRLNYENMTWLQIEKATIVVQLDEGVSAMLDHQVRLQRQSRTKKESEGDESNGIERYSREETPLAKTEDAEMDEPHDTK